MSLYDGGFFYWKKGGVCLGGRPALFHKENTRGVLTNILMIIFFPLSLNEIFQQGRNYPWPKPTLCPRCNGCRIWGHGFISACFDGYLVPLCLKRFRCPDCGCVFRLRPKGYFKRFQAPIAVIRSCIASKVQENKWLESISRSRQRHWLLALMKKIRAHLTDAWHGIIKGFDFLLNTGEIPVSRSI